jgi:hypothetical protein
MLSVPLIQRHFEHGRHEHLLEAVAANGLSLPLPLRVRLSQLPAAAVALGLRRLVELTYGPTQLSRTMLDWLMQRQQSDGGFDQDVLATAAAAAALGRVCRDHPASATPEVRNAHERAVACVAACQGDDGLMNPTPHAGDTDAAHADEQRMLATLFVLYILGEDELFRASTRYAQAMDHFEQDADDLRGSLADLWQLVCITTCGSPISAARPATPPRAPAPMLAAIAA